MFKIILDLIQPLAFNGCSERAAYQTNLGGDGDPWRQEEPTQNRSCPSQCKAATEERETAQRQAKAFTEMQ